MSAALPLPKRLDNTAAATLRDILLNARGKPLALDASEVRKLGTLCVQVLLSAKKTWKADGHALRIVNWPDAIVEKLAALALKPSDFTAEAV